MIAPPRAPVPSRARHAGIDALRAGTTLLVVFHHTAITYGAVGGWYLKEIAPDGSPLSMLLMFLCTIDQAWFMGFFFLLAGYFTPAALDGRGPWRFLRDRSIRLGIPLLVYGFVVGPATIALAQTANGEPFLDTLAWLARHGRFEKGPLWFAWALLIFAVATVVLRAVGVGRYGSKIDSAFPSNSTLLLAAIITGATAFAIRLHWPVGDEVAGLQLGYFASYVVLYTAGCIAAGPRWLERLPEGQVRTWGRVAWVALPVLPIVALAGGPLLGVHGRPEGGWNVPALVYAAWEPFVAWGVILSLLRMCRRRFSALGRTGERLARRAFAIFCIHPPVVVAVTLAWRHVAAPPLLKFAVSGCVACALCYVFAGWLLRIPKVAKVL